MIKADLNGMADSFLKQSLQKQPIFYEKGIPDPYQTR